MEKNPLETLLPYRVDGSVYPTTSNTPTTLPEYLDERSIPIEIFDRATMLPYGTAFLSLKDFVTRTIPGGKQKGVYIINHYFYYLFFV